jgi:hypothetical protein
MRELAESFESFVELYHSKDQLLYEPGFLPALQAAHLKLKEKFELAAEKNGMTGEGMRAYFEAPENFSKDDWSQMESLRQEIKEPETAPKIVKFKKNKMKKQQIKV